MPKVRERSAGAVVYREDPSVGPSSREYLLLRYGQGYWGFPKGHIEEGESEIAAAQREVMEETGIPIAAQRLVHGFRDRTDYTFRRGTLLILKEVRFYLLESATREVKLSHEHSGFAWMPYTEALERTSFEGPKRVLQLAHDFLERTGGKGERKTLDGY